MKHLALLLCFITGGILYAQQPEKIYPFARGQKPINYYKEQSALWKKEIQKDNSNVNAWYNYYYANRNLLFHDTTRVYSAKKEVVNQLVKEMGEAIPETYEYNLCVWLNGTWDMKLLPYLEKAQKIAPARPEHLDFSIVLAEMSGNKKARDEWSQKKYDAGMFSNGIIYYNYNVLSGLPKNAILLTGGDNDTYPIWYLQSLGIREDVTILHTSLVGIDEYQKEIFARLGITGNFKGDMIKHPENLELLIRMAVSNKNKAPVYVGLTVNDCSETKLGENLYLSGLAYAYSDKSIDNVALLKKNFEQEYALDYLDKQFYPDISKDLVKIVNCNYLVPMLKLYEHYKIAGDESKAQWIKKKLQAVAKDTGFENEVNKKVSAS